MPFLRREDMMFVYSFRMSTVKFLCVALLSVAVLLALVAFVPVYSADEPASTISYAKIYSDADRVDFISQFGWQVEETPIDEKNVTIPASFDKIYENYNQLQKNQGLSLGKYKGKEVTRYTYKITNYPDYEGDVYINLLVFKNKVIGGDVCSADQTGFVHGFSKDVTLP